MSTEHAYATDDPAIVAAYRDAVSADLAYGKRLNADLQALGVGKTVYVRNGFWGSSDEMLGLEPVDASVPDGWRIVRGRLEPRRGKPGEAARKWMAEHQPVDVRKVMTGHGLPRHCNVPTGTGSFRMVTPVLFEHNGTLWARYEGEPGDDFVRKGETCTWTPRKLSEFHTAREAFEEARQAVAL